MGQVLAMDNLNEDGMTRRTNDEEKLEEIMINGLGLLATWLLAGAKQLLHAESTMKADSMI